MNLYRLDFEAPDGTLDPVSNLFGNDYLGRSYTSARRDALAEANRTGRVVRITRISGAGSLKAVAWASGETHRIHKPRR
jgi:hypothetical protein